MPAKSQDPSSSGVFHSLRLLLWGLWDVARAMFVSFAVLLAHRPGLNLALLVMASNLIFVLTLQRCALQTLGPMLEVLQVQLAANSSVGSALFSASKVMAPLAWPLLWQLPIIAVSFNSANGWCQDLSDSLHRRHTGLAADTKLAKKDDDGLYAVLVWALTMVQISLLWDHIPNAIFPAAFDRVITFFVTVVPGVVRVQPLLHTSAVFFFKSVALVLQCAVYALYPFEIVWTSWGVGAEERYKVLNRRWEYFLGFGAPFVLGARTMGFFEFYALFLLTFPLTIAFASCVDYNAGYDTSEGPLIFSCPHKQKNMDILLGSGLSMNGNSSRKARASRRAAGASGSGAVFVTVKEHHRFLPELGFFEAAHHAALWLIATVASLQQLRGCGKTVAQASPAAAPAAGSEKRGRSRSRTPAKAAKGKAKASPSPARVRSASKGKAKASSATAGSSRKRK